MAPPGFAGPNAEPGAVLFKAARRTGAWLGLSDRELGQVIGAELLQSALEPGSSEWHAALSLIRLGYQLERMTGSQAQARIWLGGPNVGLGGAPSEVLLQFGGLSAVLDYVDGFSR